MDINLIPAILIALIPVVLTIIVSRLYNVVHGLITFLVMGFILMFCLQADVFGGGIHELIAQHFPKTCGIYYAIDELVLALFSGVPFITNLLAQNYGPYVALGVVVVVFVISQIIACAIRKARVERIKLLRRQVKRY